MLNSASCRDFGLKPGGGGTGLQAGETMMQEGEALAPARKLAPQEIRTFFISTSTARRRSLFQTTRMCELMISVLLFNRDKGRFQLHAFVIMREHLHLLLTPAEQESMEKCVQYIKGGFSFRAKK